MEKLRYTLDDWFRSGPPDDLIDNGLINAVSHRFCYDMGKLAENLAFLNLKRKDKDIFYWRKTQNHEVDFLIKEGTKVKEIINDYFHAAVAVAAGGVREFFPLKMIKMGQKAAFKVLLPKYCKESPVSKRR